MFRPLSLSTAALAAALALGAAPLAAHAAGGKQASAPTLSADPEADLVHQPWVNYRCAGGRKVQARYAFGEATARAELEFDGRTILMRLSDESTPDTIVFAGQGYKWLADQPGGAKPPRSSGMLMRSTTTVVNGQKTPVDEIRRRDCKG